MNCAPRPSWPPRHPPPRLGAGGEPVRAAPGSVGVPGRPFDRWHHRRHRDRGHRRHRGHGGAAGLAVPLRTGPALDDAGCGVRRGVVARRRPRRVVYPWPWLYRISERLYLSTVVGIGGGWLAAATAAGPTAGPLPVLAVV